MSDLDLLVSLSDLDLDLLESLKIKFAGKMDSPYSDILTQLHPEILGE